MIDFERVAGAPDEFWSDVECEQVLRQVERLSPDQWGEFERRCVMLPCELQARMAYVLGDIDTVASARVLLKLCGRPERDTVLTAREAARSLSFRSVKQAAADLWPSVPGTTTNEILQWIENEVPKQRG